VKLTAARLKDDSGKTLVVNNHAIEGVQLTNDTPLRITVKLDAIERRSLTAIPSV
jgi:hypothetical protein